VSDGVSSDRLVDRSIPGRTVVPEGGREGGRVSKRIKNEREGGREDKLAKLTLSAPGSPGHWHQYTTINSSLLTSVSNRAITRKRER